MVPAASLENVGPQAILKVLPSKIFDYRVLYEPQSMLFYSLGDFQGVETDLLVIGAFLSFYLL